MSLGNGGCARIASPAPGGSTLITSAPMSANILPHIGPETICANSTTFRSSSARAANNRSPGNPRYQARFLFVARQQFLAENLELALHFGNRQQALIALPHEPFGMDVL